MTQLKNEDDIKPNTGNSGCHCPLPKEISAFTGYWVNTLDPEEGTSSPHHGSYQ